MYRSRMNDRSLQDLSGALGRLNGGPDPAPSPDPDVMQAAVSLILREDGDPALLLIKRADHPTDPWSGHMALPGGRREDADASLAATAVRETREETGIDLERSGRPMGRLAEVAPSTRRLPRITIHPFVFVVPSGTAARPASSEVEAVHWVRLSELRNGTAAGTVDIAVGDGRRSFPCYRVGGEVVWGLTYRILSAFLEALPD